MRKSLLKLLGFVAGVLLSTTIFAVGMGGINVTSGLGQLLKADIELVAVSKAEKASLVARLASPEAYKSAGLDYPFGNKFKFQIESHANGEPYLRVTSAQPINDPFVVMLVDLAWSTGRLLREYTFLLDPPGYVAELPAQAEVQPVAPTVQSAIAEAAVVPLAAAPEVPVSVGQGGPAPEPAVAAAPEPAVAAAPEPAVAAAPEPAPATEAPSEPASAAASAPLEAAADQEMAKPKFALEQSDLEAEAVPENIAKAEAAAKEKEEWLTVERGDTLGKISAQFKPTDVGLERMLVALYRANANEFDGKNMNRIRAGKILRLPSQQEIDGVGQIEAVKEIHAQVADWNAYRQKLASAAPMSSQTQTTEQVATGKLASSVADKAPVAKESAKEVLKLSKGEVGDQSATGAGGKSVTAQDKKNAAQEDAIAKAKISKEEQVRTALLEKNLQDMQRLAQLKSAAAALAQQPAAAASSVATASGVKPAEVAKPKPVPVKQEQPLLDQILGEPLYLAAGAGALAILGGLGLIVRRRKTSPPVKAKNKISEDTRLRSGHITAPTIASPQTGDFTTKPAAPAETSDQSQEVDPISEADLFLNFGRDAQAEEILKDALQTAPNNPRILLKLLEIYASRKDLNSFATITRQLQDTGDADASQQALAMGRELDPGNPVYGSGGALEDKGGSNMKARAFEDMPRFVSGEAAKAPSVDFDLGASAEKLDSSPEPEKDFFADVDEAALAISSAELAAQPAAEMDFDVTSTPPASPAAGKAIEFTLPELDETTLDAVRNKFSSNAASVDVSKPSQADDTMMEFTLDFPAEGKVEKSAPTTQPADVGLAGINLNFDDVAAPVASTSEIKGERWQEVATKLDLAKAYQEMGDASGAREILDEVLREGDAEQRQVAQTLIAQLG